MGRRMNEVDVEVVEDKEDVVESIRLTHLYVYKFQWKHFLSKFVTFFIVNNLLSTYYPSQESRNIHNFQ